MGHLCDFCGDQRAIVYCRSDAAGLCLSCDRNVHSANALSRRHSRTLLCERCHSQPASIRCVHETISLCQNCDWNAHSSNTTTTSNTSHERQTINCYSGCPSAEELSRIWSFVMDVPAAADDAPVDNYACERKMGLMSIDENCVSDNYVARHHQSNTTVELSTNGERSNVEDAGQCSTWTGSSSMQAMNSNQLAGSGGSTTAKPSCLGLKGIAPGEDDLYNEFNMADVDIDFDNYEELFGMCQNQPEQDTENGSIDSLFGVKDMYTADSDSQGGFFAEDSSGKFKLMQSVCSDAASADSGMSAKTEPNFCYSARQAHSNLSISFSGLTGECNAGDYQDSGVSSMLRMDESPWLPPGPENSFTSASRDSAVMRYKEKKKARKFDKKIRYESRKARADVRKRVKGRFVKAGEAYDYDPMCQTRSC